MINDNPLPLTQRAYTLRLRGLDHKDQSWRDHLWKTHEAVNLGAKAFGDWLLTMRGGLSHELAAQLPDKISKLPEEQQRAHIRDRRIILALSWLSVESNQGAPQQYLVPNDLDTTSGARSSWKTVDALQAILTKRGAPAQEIEQWVADCSSSLSAAIRDDAVWVNRSQAFDDAQIDLGSALTREHVYSLIVGEFLPAYFTAIEAEEDSKLEPTLESENTVEQPEFRNWARGWLSSHWGTGQKSDNTRIAESLDKAVKAGFDHLVGGSGDQLIAYLISILGGSADEGEPIDQLRKIIGWKTGRSSKGRLALGNIQPKFFLTLQDIEVLKKKLSEEFEEKNKNAHREVAEWINKLQIKIEKEVGIPFIVKRNLIGEFAVMLDHAARRVSLAHTWIKRAEWERRRFEQDARKIDRIPISARKWLDDYCDDRLRISGALDAYRIRKRAVEGWREVVAAWSKNTCKTEQDRIDAARELQADPEIEKFGDIQLFEALAAEDAVCVWKREGESDPQPLFDYASATDAEAKQRRFKVPAYRHPHPLSHPVFCDFGKSRWDISFSVHESAKRKKSEGSVGINDLTLCLWNGSDVCKTSLRWSSKRLVANLNLGNGKRMPESVAVSRADRLGRAASGAKHDAQLIVPGLFEQDEWNGRLQAPRSNLDQLSEYLEKRGNRWDAKAQKMRDRLRWLITFSPKLQPIGPWIAFAERNGLRTDPKYWPHALENKKRQALGRLILSRLPGLRILSVDLGHRFAAACAVWQTLTSDAFQNALTQARQAGAIVCKNDLYASVRYPERESNKVTTKARSEERIKRFAPTTVYRRIGPDVLPDGNPHPAPWARLDRQFVIKLQGENEDARKAGKEEIEMVKKFNQELGTVTPNFDSLMLSKKSYKGSWAVDELMSKTVRTARLGLKRHGDRARIAYGLTARRKLLPGGRVAEQEMSLDERVKHLQDVLMLWNDLFSSRNWKDEAAEKLWAEHVKIGLDEVPDDLSGKVRKQKRQSNREKLRPVAELLAKQDNIRLHAAWAQHWQKENEQWRLRLRWLRDWILPRGSRKHDPSLFHVGGLSLTRIATIKSLYQIQKAFRMRPEPEDLRTNIPAKGDDALRNFGSNILQALERMRESRVKQLASRIAEAALGIGKEQSRTNGKEQKRPRERITDARFDPCHAVVIENLTRYRPEETRTRRENRQLMSWSSSKVKKYLAEACQLSGLHLCEVSAAYTSRQDSRTGAPGIRCQDISVQDFLAPQGYWAGEINRGLEKKENKSRLRDELLVDLRKYLENTKKDPTDLIRVPHRGGEIFVSADTDSAKGLQADLNAAANIGLKALLDPDWPARWWYVPCDPLSFKPMKEKVQGSMAFDPQLSMANPANVEGSQKKRQKKSEAEKSIVNLWRDPSTTPVIGGGWKKYEAYWNDAEARVINILRRQIQVDESF